MDLVTAEFAADLQHKSIGALRDGLAVVTKAIPDHLILSRWPGGARRIADELLLILGEAPPTRQFFEPLPLIAPDGNGPNRLTIGILNPDRDKGPFNPLGVGRRRRQFQI
jgi:hypothetical protein